MAHTARAGKQDKDKQVSALFLNVFTVLLPRNLNIKKRKTKEAVLIGILKVISEHQPQMFPIFDLNFEEKGAAYTWNFTVFKKKLAIGQETFDVSKTPGGFHDLLTGAELCTRTMYLANWFQERHSI